MKVMVHGGAGGPPDQPEQRKVTLTEAAERGAECDTVLDAVEAAVNVLEAEPLFGAGVGGAVQLDGTIRTDAGVMTGDLEAGAACSMTGVENAISVARVVMEETPHVLVSGGHAVALADAFGIETGVDLWDEETRERWMAADVPTGELPDQLATLEAWFDEADEDSSKNDTVGAVATDGDAFASATSTNGRHLALAGRVGDVPQIGSGFYASPAGAASTTGAGEDIAKVTLARRCVHYLETGRDAQSAAGIAIEEFEELTGSRAGLIVLDRAGNVGRAYNSGGMQTATARR